MLVARRARSGNGSASAPGRRAARALGGRSSGQVTSSQSRDVLRRRFRARTPRQSGRNGLRHAGRWRWENPAGAGTGGGYYHHRTSGLLKKFAATVSVYSLAGAVMRSSKVGRAGHRVCGDDRLIRGGALSGGGSGRAPGAGAGAGTGAGRGRRAPRAGGDNVGVVGCWPGWPGPRFNVDLPLLAASVRLCAGAMACVAICGDGNGGVPAWDVILAEAVRVKEDAIIEI